MSQYLNLAKKIHALAKAGADGEKVNAEVLLNKLMKKHGLTMADLEDETIKLHSFKVPKEDHKLFHQISALVLGKDYEILWNSSRPSALYINCTKSVAIEIESKFEFYSGLYKEELKVFYKSFIITHNLMLVKEGSDDDILTDEEKKLAQRIGIISLGLTKTKYTKQLSGNKNHEAK